MQNRIREFRVCFDNSPIAFSVLHLLRNQDGEISDFEFAYVNQSLARLEEQPLERMMGHRIYEIYPGASGEWLDFFTQAAEFGRIHSLKAYFNEIHKHILLLAYPLQKDYCACIMNDITEQEEKTASYENRLAYDNQRLMAVLSDSGIYAFECDLTTDTLYNDSYQDAEGYTQVMPDYPEAFIAAYVHPDSADDYRRLYADMKKGRLLSQAKIRYRFRSKEELMLVRFRNSFDQNGKPVRMFGTAQSLSALDELDRQFHFTMEQHGIYSWVIDAKNNVFTASETFLRDYGGYHVGTVANGGGHSDESRGIHPDDEDVFDTTYQALLRGKKTVRTRIRRKNKITGEWDWLSACFDGVYDSAGTLSKIYASAVNINKQVESEERYAEFQSIQRMAMKNVTAAIRLNLTQNLCSQSPIWNTNDLMELDFHTVDEFWSYILQFVPDEEQHREMTEKLNRHALLSAFSKGVTVQEFEVEYDFRGGGRRWSRSVVEMMENPYTHDVEALVYSIDVDRQHMLMQIVDRLVGMDYELLGVISLDTETVQFYKQSELETSVNTPQMLYYPTGSAAFFQGLVAPEDLEQVVRENSIEVICRELEKQMLYTTSAKVVADGKPTIKKWAYTYLDDRRSNIVYTRTDITDIMENQRKEQEALHQALEQAKCANNAKTEFLSRMSHDMRTPMNAIIGFSGIGMDSVTLEEAKEALSKIHDSGLYLLGMINDVLEMSRIESGKTQLHYEPYQYDEFESTLRTILEPLAEPKKITLTFRSNVDRNLIAYFDHQRLQQIFINLIGNAIKFTPAGGHVELRTEYKQEKAELQYAHFTISDDGIGMTAAFMQNKMYRSFEQEQRLESVENGTGLGLSIVKHLVELMDGTISCQSEPGKGTVFTVALPVQLAERHGKRLKTDLPLDGKQLEGRRILLCEDHPLNAQIAQRLLQKVGIETEHVVNGAMGVEAFAKSAEGGYDAILMDIRMPVMDGLAAARAIRALERPDAKTVPIIAMTANAFDEDAERSMEAGMNAHLSKPVDPQSMYETILRLIQQKPKPN